MNKDYRFEHGQTVRDIVTRYQGVVTGRADYITGCNQYAVTPRLKSSASAHKEVEGRWFDEDRLTPLRIGRVAVPQRGATTGGPQHVPHKR